MMTIFRRARLIQAFLWPYLTNKQVIPKQTTCIGKRIIEEFRKYAEDGGKSETVIADAKYKAQAKGPRHDKNVSQFGDFC